MVAKSLFLVNSEKGGGGGGGAREVIDEMVVATFERNNSFLQTI